ncbi:MAG: response regulator [Candidatus Rokubacteria bacterium]|nr:response regulator [Candidatus Rokubacteria bacterium]
MRVLVVEDELDVGGVFCDFLLELGHQPLVARSAEAALGHLQAERPDAIILDINLPGMNGLEFLRSRPIRESGVPIVAVSGVATESQARECLRLGALDFVGKPVPLQRLSEVLGYIEPHALYRKRAEAGRHVERRRCARVPMTIPVRVLEYNGTEWQGTSIDLSPFGMKLRTQVAITPGAAAKLTFVPPDGGAAIQVMSVLVRVDPNGHVFYFVNLTADDFHRLHTLTTAAQ